MVVRQLRLFNFGNHFIRQRDFLGELTHVTTPLDIDDSLFDIVRGLADPSGVSFRSFNFPDRYIRHRDFHLFVEPKDSPNLAVDATFFEMVRID